MPTIELSETHTDRAMKEDAIEVGAGTHHRSPQKVKQQL